MKILAVDPGAQGGFAVISDQALIDHGEFCISPDRLDLSALLPHRDAKVIVIEKMHSMPSGGFKNGFGIGAKANWLRGFSNGVLLCWAKVHRIPRIMEPAPIKWQKAMLDGVQGLNSKQQSVNLAAYFYPKAILKTERGRVLDGVADAINLAAYGQRIILSER